MFDLVDGLLPFLPAIGKWITTQATEHPTTVGVLALVFLSGVVFQHAVRLAYPDYATRPTWARWVVWIAAAFTATFKKPPESTPTTVPASSVNAAAKT